MIQGPTHNLPYTNKYYEINFVRLIACTTNFEPILELLEVGPLIISNPIPHYMHDTIKERKM